jgi:hypothetical protein
MTTMERLRVYLDSKGIVNARAEKECGLSNGLIGNAVKTLTAVGSDKLEKILSVYSDLSAEWLLRGVGDMIIGEGKAKELESKVAKMCDGKRDQDEAYDIILSMLDMVTKTYEFYGKR